MAASMSLICEGGDKAQGDGHHHGQLVRRKMQLAQGLEQRLHAVAQGDGRDA